MNEAEIGFCPFCRQDFVGAARCPEHDLALVPADRLARSIGPTEDEVASGGLRSGRLLVLAGAVLVLGGFLAPNFVDAGGALAPKSGLATAVEKAPVLWLVPAAGAILGSLALRRAQRLELRRARLAILGLAMIAAAVELHVVRRVTLAETARAAERAIALGLGVPLVLAGAAVAFVGALLVGLRR